MNETDCHNGDTDAFDLADFIDVNSALFVTMGVFAALALYISQASPTELTEAAAMIQMGFVASFLIAILIFALIYGKMHDEFGSWHTLLRAHTRFWENPALTAFTFFAILLGISVSYVLARHQLILLMVSFVAVAGLGYALGMSTIYWVVKRIPRTPVWRIGTGLSGSIIVLIVTFYLRMNVLSQFQMTTVSQLSLSDPIPIVINTAPRCVSPIVCGRQRAVYTDRYTNRDG